MSNYDILLELVDRLKDAKEANNKQETVNLLEDVVYFAKEVHNSMKQEV